MSWKNLLGFLRRKPSTPLRNRVAPKPTLVLEALENRLVPTASIIGPDWFKAPAFSTLPAMAAKLPKSEWIVELKDQHANSLASVNDATKYLKSSSVHLQVVKGLGEKGIFLVQGFGNSLAVRNALLRLPAVKTVGANAVVSIQNLNRDPLGGDLWGLHNTGQTIKGVAGAPDADIDFPEARLLAKIQTQVVVGVVDTGIDYLHPDLKGNMWVNPGEVPGNNQDDDGNGFVDDVHGYDFANDDSDPMDDNSWDGVFHGTHVAGTIAATMGNGIGIAGIADGGAKLMALKFLNSQGRGSVADAIRATNYATMMAERGVNLKVLNNSWGASPGQFMGKQLEDAITASAEAGIMFVAAAGNDANDNDKAPSYPASYATPNMVSVAANNNRDQITSFSNFGAKTVHLSAPGQAILSTQAGGKYQFLSGTSMAAPHVSGALALAWACHPGTSLSEMRDQLFESVDDISSLSGMVSSGGRLNLRNLLVALDHQAPNAPAGPSKLQVAEMGRDFAQLTWVDNSGEETSFELEMSTNEGKTWQTVQSLPSDTVTAKVSGLNPGTPYLFRVFATNSAGPSERSNTVKVLIQGGAPVAPTQVRAETVQSRRVQLTWKDNSANETGFQVLRSANGGSTWNQVGTVEPNTTRFWVGDLDPEKPYVFAVQATGLVKDSPLARSSTITTAPHAPGNVRVENIRMTTLDLVWTDESRAETGFRIFRSTDDGGNWTQIGTSARNATRFQVRGLSASTTYQFMIRAVGNQGVSDPSNVVSATTPGQTPTPTPSPATPTDLRATHTTETTVTLRWVDQSNNESGFRVEGRRGQGAWEAVREVSANLTEIKLTDLVPNTQYGFRVRSVRGSAVSAPSNEVLVTTQPPNNAPGARPDEARTRPGLAVTVPVMENDLDPDGDPLRIVDFQAKPAGGTVRQEGNNLVFVPDGAYVGSRNFSYTVEDTNGSRSVAMVTIHFVNQAPIAGGDSLVTTTRNNAVVLDVLANDQDPDGDALRMFLENGPRKGRVELQGRQWVYIPNPGFRGQDQFDYRAEDPFGARSKAIRVRIQVGNIPGQNPVSGNRQNHIDYDGDGIGDLVFVQKTGTGSGTTEVHVLNGADGYRSYLLQTGTALHQTGEEWSFEPMDFNGDGHMDLVGVNRAGGGSGRVEVHVLNGATNYQTFLMQTATAFFPTGAAGVFRVADMNRDGVQDLVLILKSGTGSQSTEVHAFDGRNFGEGHFARAIFQTGTALHETGDDCEFELGDQNGDGIMDLWFIRKHNTGSGRVEAHVFSGADLFRSHIMAVATPLPPAFGETEFELSDRDGDGKLDLYYVRKSPNGSQGVELHVLSAASTFQTHILHTSSALIGGHDGSFGA